jgi:hypothetical protein
MRRKMDPHHQQRGHWLRLQSITGTSALENKKKHGRRYNLSRAARGSGFTRVEVNGLLDILQASELP